MIGAQASAANVQNVLPPASYAAGANNGQWVDVRSNEGELLVGWITGAVAGSVVFQLQDATDIGGTGAASFGAPSASISTANSAGKLVFVVNATRGFVRMVATVTTGPVFAAASVAANQGYF